MGKCLWYLSAALIFMAIVAGVGIYFGYVKPGESAKGQSVLDDMWMLHPFERMVKERVRINNTCYNLFHKDIGRGLVAELCPIKDIYKGQSRVEIIMESKKAEQRVETALYWVEAEDLDVFRADLIDYPRLHSIKANGTCYSYESSGSANKTYEFLPIDCTYFLPALCKGLHSENCPSTSNL